jgi:hypothetical protein
MFLRLEARVVIVFCQFVRPGASLNGILLGDFLTRRNENWFRGNALNVCITDVPVNDDNNECTMNDPHASGRL